MWCVMCLCDIYCVPVSHFPSDCNLLSIQAPTWRSEQLVISIDWSHGKKMEMVSASICLPDISCFTTATPPLYNILSTSIPRGTWPDSQWQPSHASSLFAALPPVPGDRMANWTIELKVTRGGCHGNYGMWWLNKKGLLGFAEVGAIGSISNFVWI